MPRIHIANWLLPPTPSSTINPTSSPRSVCGNTCLRIIGNGNRKPKGVQIMLSLTEIFVFRSESGLRTSTPPPHIKHVTRAVLSTDSQQKSRILIMISWLHCQLLKVLHKHLQTHVIGEDDISSRRRSVRGIVSGGRIQFREQKTRLPSTQSQVSWIRTLQNTLFLSNRNPQIPPFFYI